jgi:signal transduction histidine kinase
MSGSLTVTLLLTYNILKRKKAEARLRDSEQNYKQLSQQFKIILEGIPDGLTLVSKEMKVIWSNQGTGNYFNRMLGSIPGEYCCKLLYNRAEICENCPAVKVFASGRNEEATVTTPDGQILEVKAFPVRDGDGEIVNVIMHAADITEKTRLREEAIRGSRLASLGELAAGVAHEINNPNALILFNGDLARKSWDDAAPILHRHYQAHGDFPLGGLRYSEMREELPLLLAEMLEGGRRIKRIVDDLKDFVRQDGPELNERVDLNEVVRAALRLINSAIKKSTDRFEVCYGENLPYFAGSFQRIEQVAVNLIMNACQALPAKDRGLRVETLFDPAASRLRLTVRDQGVGIASRDLPHISEPFFTTKREHGGTGLGLSVAARIIADHRGSLEFQSTVDVGTTATLSLPAIHEGESHE